MKGLGEWTEEEIRAWAAQLKKRGCCTREEANLMIEFVRLKLERTAERSEKRAKSN